MGVLDDYFAAPSDDEAAATIGRVGGPGSRFVTVADEAGKTRGFLRRKRQAEPRFVEDGGLAVYDTVSAKGIDPVVQMGTLEELLSGRAYDDIVEDPRSGKVLASMNNGTSLVLTTTDSLLTALAASPEEQLIHAARTWSETEEFWGHGDPVQLADFLRELAGLARRAQIAGHRLYCWVSV